MRKANVVVVNHFMYDKENYFELFAVPQAVEINEKSLHSNFLKLQQLVHPDKLSSKSEAERILAAELSAKLNRGYSVLIDDKKRAEYLLYLQGIIINQEDNNNVHADPLMLNEILEMNESPEKYNLTEIKNTCYENFKKLYIEGSYKQAAHYIMKLQYVSKL